MARTEQQKIDWDEFWGVTKDEGLEKAAQRYNLPWDQVDQSWKNRKWTSSDELKRSVQKSKWSAWFWWD